MDKLMRFLTICLLVAFGVHAGNALAQAYPNKPITIILPYAVGGAVDGLARLLALKMSETMKTPVVVKNIGGASGTLGMAETVRAQPDGYTVLYVPNTIAIMPALYKKLSFDVEKDLIPVSQFVSSALVLVAHPKINVSSVKELIELAKSKPGKLNFGSSGVADTLQVGMEWVKTLAGIDMVAIPYKGQGPMFLALLGGEVDLAICSQQIAVGPIREGRIRALAVAGPKRSAALPDVPTIAESGLPGYDLVGWHGVFAPAGTPRPIIDELARAITWATQQPDVRQNVENAGNEAIGGTPEQFQAKFVADVAKFKTIARDARIPPQDGL